MASLRVQAIRGVVMARGGVSARRRPIPVPALDRKVSARESPRRMGACPCFAPGKGELMFWIWIVRAVGGLIVMGSLVLVVVDRALYRRALAGKG